MLEGFYSCVFHDAPKVLGYKLRTFSVYHLALLRAVNSPFISGLEIRPSDVIIFAKICTLKHGEILKSFSFYDRVKERYLCLNQHVFIKNVLNLMQFRENSMAGPTYWESEKGISLRDLSAPYEAALVVKLTKAGFRNAWDMQIGLSMWLMAVIDELDGDVRTYSDPLAVVEVETPEQILEKAKKELTPAQLEALKEKIKCR
jgi:hypothetical protein